MLTSAACQGIEPAHQKFLFAGKSLDDAKTLKQCGLVEGSVIKAVLVGVFRA
jgi:hypothetical protein